MADETQARSVPRSRRRNACRYKPSGRTAEDRKFSPRVYIAPKTRRRTLIVVVAIVLLIGGVLLWRYLSTYESTDDAQVDVHLYPVSARISGYT